MKGVARRTERKAQGGFSILRFDVFADRVLRFRWFRYLSFTFGGMQNDLRLL